MRLALEASGTRVTAPLNPDVSNLLVAPDLKLPHQFGIDAGEVVFAKERHQVFADHPPIVPVGHGAQALRNLS